MRLPVLSGWSRSAAFPQAEGPGCSDVRLVDLWVLTRRRRCTLLKNINIFLLATCSLSLGKKKDRELQSLGEEEANGKIKLEDKGGQERNAGNAAISSVLRCPPAPPHKSAFFSYLKKKWFTYRRISLPSAVMKSRAGTSHTLWFLRIWWQVAVGAQLPHGPGSPRISRYLGVPDLKLLIRISSFRSKWNYTSLIKRISCLKQTLNLTVGFGVMFKAGGNSNLEESIDLFILSSRGISPFSFSQGQVRTSALCWKLLNISLHYFMSHIKIYPYKFLPTE